MAGTGFYLGDELLCTRNLWEWGLQNGSLGRLVEIEDTPRLFTNSEGVEIEHAIGFERRAPGTPFQKFSGMT